MLDKAKQDYYKGKQDGADTKVVFKTVNNLLNKNTKILPAHSDSSKLANEFGSFFAGKVSKIYGAIESELGNLSYVDCNVPQYTVVRGRVNNSLQPSLFSLHGCIYTKVAVSTSSMNLCLSCPVTWTVLHAWLHYGISIKTMHFDHYQ